MDRRRTVAGVNGYPLHGRERPGRAAGSPAARPCVHASQKSPDALTRPAVPKPTQVGGYKHTKARERNLVKELGNIAP